MGSHALAYDGLDMIDEEEAMPLRPMTVNNQHAPPRGTLFGASD